MKTLAALVNLLTLIAEAILGAVKRGNYEDNTAKAKEDTTRLHENPGRFIADMFGTRGDSLRSEAQANDKLRTDKANP